MNISLPHDSIDELIIEQGLHLNRWGSLELICICLDISVFLALFWIALALTRCLLRGKLAGLFTGVFDERLEVILMLQLHFACFECHLFHRNFEARNLIWLVGNQIALILKISSHDLVFLLKATETLLLQA